MTKQKKTKGLVIYQGKSGAIELRGDVRNQTIWATLDQIAVLFGRDKSVISRHLKNIFLEKELDRKAVVAKNATTASDGKVYQVEYFNLDVIISVGYRVNSKTATEFRKWATKTLRSYIVDGYAINRKRVAQNYSQFAKAVESVRALLPAGGGVGAGDTLELISLFADTWLSLDAYDKGALPKGKLKKKKVIITGEKLAGSLGELKSALIKKGEATDLFGTPREKDPVGGIVGNVMQTFGGKEVYSTAEEKAAHLLYFMVKNHPFADGNKRSGAFAFVWFLRQAKLLDSGRLTPQALTALTVLVAESDPAHKDKVVKLILGLIAPR